MDSGADSMLTVACLFVKGEYPYTAEYVERLYAGVRKHLAWPFRFVCLTDQPWLFTSPIDTIVVRPLPVRHAFWTKLRLFDQSLGLEGRVLYLDLDTLVLDDLSPIVDYPAAFTCAADCLAPSLEGPPVPGVKGERLWIPRYQGSVMVWDAGPIAWQLWSRWQDKYAERYYTDQDWMGDVLPHQPVMPVEWFPRLSQVTYPLPSEAKVLLVKKPKNVDAAAKFPWFNELWRAA